MAPGDAHGADLPDSGAEEPEERSATREIPRHAGVWENLGASHGAPPGKRPGLIAAQRLFPFLGGLLFVGFLIANETGFVELDGLRFPAMIFLTVVLIQLALRQQAEERSLDFYDRFIRPGLKTLLEQEGRNMTEGDKFFRGRKTVILKIDMVGYTKTTFDMPYGMRRLFQDLWFTLIDQVVAERVFLDKSLGDGSLYCLENPWPTGACTQALKSAIEIRDVQVHRFDRVFRRRLREQMAREPGLAQAAESYFERYRQQAGQDFWSRETRIRMALVTGYVDEGLWGLSSQSHYDVLGAPVILATRLEDQAQDGEIVMDQFFVDELTEESPDLLDPSLLHHRRPSLKGIGPWDVFALPPGAPEKRLRD